MCRAILEGLRKYLDRRGRARRGVKATIPLGAVPMEEQDYTLSAGSLGVYLAQHGMNDIVDATTGQVLKGELVQKARAEEMDYFYCLLYTSPSPRDGLLSRMPSSA